MALADKIKQLAQAVAGDVKTLQGEMSGKQPLSPTLTNTTASFTTALLTKLNGIAAEASKNSTDAHLLSRSNHTGTQSIGTIDGLEDALADAGQVKTVAGESPDSNGNVSLSKSSVGLDQVDNTSDADKPISSAQLAALNNKANNNDLVGLATETWVENKNYLTTHQDISGKVDKQTGYGLSQENYSLTEKNKLSSIESGAQVNAVPIDNLTTPDATVPLSASQGKALKGLIDGINTILQSDDTNLDELQEIVDFVKLNRDTLDSLSIESIAGLSTALNNKQPLATVLTNTSASFTTTLLTKLNGISAEASKNATDAHLLSRGNHTGTQALSTIEDLETELEKARGFDESPAPPVSPSPGHRWLDTTTGIEYTWFEDADSGQWVELGPVGSGSGSGGSGGGGSSGIVISESYPSYSNPTDASLWVHVNSGEMHGWFNGEWRLVSTGMPFEYTYSISSRYDNVPTKGILADGETNNHAATHNSTNEWISIDFPNPVDIVEVQIACAGGGWGPQYLNGATLQTSSDFGASFTDVRVLAGYVNNLIVSEPINATVTNIRLWKAAYIGVSEFAPIRA